MSYFKRVFTAETKARQCGLLILLLWKVYLLKLGCIVNPHLEVEERLGG